MQQTRTVLLMVSGIAAIGILAIAPAVLAALTQEVYAPSGRRGMFCGDLPDAVRGAAPGESDGAICWCDDTIAMQTAADKFYNSN